MTSGPRDLETLPPAPPVGITFHSHGTFEFDGHRFARDWATLHIIYLAARARRGDQLARDLLAASDVLTVHDADGRPYWPPHKGGR